ncbi:hypothetical protein SELMODRAFT_439076 [Selaginella moellendorffii]|uniref:RNA 3'-terminal phosphate cyclase domain-containing protein n=1 Tax=Selaginella moellendorffii TaxID=88036 RepID=D8R2A0_SELML|nr:hypothetical protein SELMODRAFT_439076 [Selaginella moellendorffii]
MVAAGWDSSLIVSTVLIDMYAACIANDSRDPCVDTFRTATLPMLKHFGVPIEFLELKVVACGTPPLGGSEVVLKVPIVPKSLTISGLWDLTGDKNDHRLHFKLRVRGYAFRSIRAPASRGPGDTSSHVLATGDKAGRSCKFNSPDVSKVKVGKLSSYDIKTLQHIKEFLGVQFSIKPDPATGMALLTCIGSGFQNLYRKVS